METLYIFIMILSMQHMSIGALEMNVKFCLWYAQTDVQDRHAE